jgi:TRAP-type C4-dicarboxylate transport system permease small subunit
MSLSAILTPIYRACEALACGFMALIAAAILAQIFGRLAGHAVAGADDIAGYAMAASAFLALAGTLRAGGHIRVALLIQFLPRALRHAIEIMCTIVGTAMFAYASWYFIQMTYESWEFGDVASGHVAFPLWIPQAGLSLGLVVMALSFLEETLRVLRGDMPIYESSTATLLEAEQIGDALKTPGERG